MSDTQPGRGGTGGFSATPDAEGWHVRETGPDDGFVAAFGTIRVRPEGEGKARLRFDTHGGLRNYGGNVHGGFLLAVIDQSLFVGPAACGIAVLGGVTVDVSSQFLGPVVIGPPIEVTTELLRETGRMAFVRGLIAQDGEARVAFAGTLRKPG